MKNAIPNSYEEAIKFNEIDKNRHRIIINSMVIFTFIAFVFAFYINFTS